MDLEHHQLRDGSNLFKTSWWEYLLLDVIYLLAQDAGIVYRHTQREYKWGKYIFHKWNSQFIAYISTWNLRHFIPKILRRKLFATRHSISHPCLKATCMPIISIPESTRLCEIGHVIEFDVKNQKYWDALNLPLHFPFPDTRFDHVIFEASDHSLAVMNITLSSPDFHRLTR